MTDGLERVRNYITQRGIDPNIAVFNDSTESSELAADALGCGVAEIAKSVVFTGTQTYVVVVSGDMRVSTSRLSSALGSKVRLAPRDEVKNLTGYVAGGVPPFPHNSGVRTLVDASLKRFKNVWTAGGETNAVFRIPVQTLIEISGGAEVNVSEQRAEKS
jgi:prolyl-tRNA editing enzyme YbaK/EbsC (Cys-tRNA(Pro) deacylase)